MSIIKINQHNYESEVLRSEKKVLLDFYADWCGPCRMLSGVVDKLAQEYPEYKVCKVNVDEEPELAAAYGVMSIPALYVIENGKVVNQSLGLKRKPELLEMLR